MLAETILNARRPGPVIAAVRSSVATAATKAGGRKVEWLNRRGYSFIFPDGSTLAIDKTGPMAAHGRHDLIMQVDRDGRTR